MCLNKCYRWTGRGNKSYNLSQKIVMIILCFIPQFYLLVLLLLVFCIFFTVISSMIFFSHTSVKYVKDQYIKLFVFQIELNNGKVFFLITNYIFRNQI